MWPQTRVACVSEQTLDKLHSGPTQILRESRVKWLGIAAFFGVLLYSTVEVVESGSVARWVALGLFGVGTMGAAWQVVFPDRLVIGTDEIEITRFGLRRRYRLDRCEEFVVWGFVEPQPRSILKRINDFMIYRNTYRGSLVVFGYAEDDPGRLSRANRWVSGSSSWIPHRYGLEAEELAQILNRARRRALGLDPEDG